MVLILAEVTNKYINGKVTVWFNQCCPASSVDKPPCLLKKALGDGEDGTVQRKPQRVIVLAVSRLSTSNSSYKKFWFSVASINII